MSQTKGKNMKKIGASKPKVSIKEWIDYEEVHYELYKMSKKLQKLLSDSIESGNVLKTDIRALRSANKSVDKAMYLFS